MKHQRILWKSCVLILCLWAGYILQSAQVSQPPRRAETAAPPASKLAVSYAKMPLGFEANQGQTDNRVKFISHGRGYGLFLTSDEAVLKLRSKGPGPRIQNLIARRQLSVLSPQLLPTPNIVLGTPDLGLTNSGNRPRMADSVVRLHLMGANPNASVAGE